MSVHRSRIRLSARRQGRSDRRRAEGGAASLSRSRLTREPGLAPDPLGSRQSLACTPPKYSPDGAIMLSPALMASSEPASAASLCQDDELMSRSTGQVRPVFSVCQLPPSLSLFRGIGGKSAPGSHFTSE